jgi:hypothetical protein
MKHTLNNCLPIDCGYIDKKIICFGGGGGLEVQHRTELIDSRLSDKVYSLDLGKLTKSDGTFTSLKEASEQWTEVKPTNPTDYIVEPRTRACSVTYGGNSLLIYGGYTFNGGGTLINQTIAYNATANSWKTLPNYYATLNETKQMFVFKELVELDMLTTSIL